MAQTSNNPVFRRYFTQPAAGNYRWHSFYMPLEFQEAFFEVFSLLMRENSWKEREGGLSTAAQAQIAYNIMQQISAGETDMLGSLVLMMIDHLPVGVVPLDGSTYSKDTYPDFYAVAPTDWIDGDNFTLPDLSGLFPMGTTDPDAINETGGEAEHTLTYNEMPIHDHGTTIPVSSEVIPGELPIPIPTAVPFPSVTDPAGGDQPHNNLPPYFKALICIRVAPGCSG